MRYDIKNIKFSLEGRKRIKWVERDIFVCPVSVGKRQGFTLIELLVVIAIVGFLTTIAIYYLNVTKMQGRDASRAANVSTMNKALAIYINEYGVYPSSDGECLSGDSGVGAELISTEAIVFIPIDPVAPLSSPASVNCQVNSAGRVISCAQAGTASCYCYWYESDGDTYYLNYYLEIDSKSGDAGIHTMSPAGEY